MDAPWIATAVAVALLVATATVALAFLRVPGSWEPAVAILRAAVQLALLSLVLSVVITDPLWVAIGLVVMLLAAIGTAARRARTPARGLLPLAAAMALGPAVVLAIAFGTTALALEPRYALALGGIVIGNPMTIAVLTQRIYRATVFDHWDEVEGWLALGATRWQSTRDLARASIRTALLPSLDQTRTTGIVVLPGAFVGAVFAGASPLEAGRFQLIVLAGVLAAGALTSTTLVRLGGGFATKPESAAVR